MAQANRTRIVVIGILVAFLGLAGALLSIPLLMSDPLPVVRPGGGASFSVGDGADARPAQLQVGAAGGFALVVAMAPSDGDASPPRVVLEMPDHPMPAVEPDVEVVDGDHLQASGRLEMPGHWRLRIVEDADTHVFDFMLAEF